MTTRRSSLGSRSLRRRDAMHLHGLCYGPNTTPMVDVVMVILIFYMSVASFAGTEWFLRSGLPRPGAGPGGSQTQADPFDLGAARFEITLGRGADGRTTVRGQGFEGLSIDELPGRLRSLAAGTGQEDLVLVIRAESGVPYGDVIRAHDAAAAAGITKVGLMDTRPDGAGGPQQGSP